MINMIHLIKVFTILLFSAEAFAQSLLTEDFSKNNLGWKTYERDVASASIENGEYKIKHLRDKAFWYEAVPVFINPSKEYSIETSIKQISGDTSIGYGLLFGASGWKNCYFFLISSNGNMWFGSYLEKTPNIFHESPLKSGIVKPQGQFNKLKIEAKNKQLIFSVNNTVVHTANTVKFFDFYTGFMIERQQDVSVDYLSISPAPEAIKLPENLTYGYKKENLGPGINSTSVEITPIVSPDGSLLFINRDGHPRNIGTQDIWYSTIKPDGSWEDAVNIGFPLNNKSSNSVISVSADNNSLLLSGLYNPDGNPAFGDGISISFRTLQGWSIPEPVVINNYKNKNRFRSFSLAANRKTLLMATEMDDSYGDLDLYVSFLQPDGKFSAPVNLGPTINTFTSDYTPFLASDNITLYFASEGHRGYGSADIFMTKRLDSTWTKWSEPVNLGTEINSPQWEAYFSIPASGEYAYMVQNNQITQSDIFRIKLPNALKPAPVVMVKGKVLDAKTLKPLEADVKYTLLGTETEMGIARSNPADGQYSIVLTQGNEYGFLAQKKGYYPISENIYIQTLDTFTLIARDLLLTPIEQGQVMRLNNLFFDTGSDKLKKNSFGELHRVIALMKEYPNMQVEIAGHTDADGDEASNQKLSDARALAVGAYLQENGIAGSRFKTKGYGKTNPVSNNDTPEGKALNRRVELRILKM
jgi:outer membrane protein OmpA-like peptidoglycan-associated protein